MKKYKHITVWAGAAPTISACHYEPMYEIGQILAQNKITMVYGIGDEGMMGAAFKGVRSKNHQGNCNPTFYGVNDGYWWI